MNNNRPNSRAGRKIFYSEDATKGLWEKVREAKKESKDREKEKAVIVAGRQLVVSERVVKGMRQRRKAFGDFEIIEILTRY